MSVLFESAAGYRPMQRISFTVRTCRFSPFSFCSLRFTNLCQFNFPQELDEFNQWVTSWDFVGARKRLPVQVGWILAIASMKEIIKECLFTMNFKFVLTGRFNQDCVEVNGRWLRLGFAIPRGMLTPGNNLCLML